MFLRSVLLLVVGVGAVCGEVFTALVHMEGLLELEGELLASLNSYITAERQRSLHCQSIVVCDCFIDRLKTLDVFAERVHLAHNHGADNSQRHSKEYSFNPINAFHLLNRYAHEHVR